MGFSRVVLISVCVFSGILGADKCENCQIRNFIKKTQECTCPKNQFCNVTTKKCKQCDYCYDNCNQNIQKRKIEYENILSYILSKYETNLPELKKLLNILKTNLQKREAEFGTLETLEEIVEKKILKVDKLTKQLKDDLKKVDDLLNNLKFIKPLKEVDSELENIKSILKSLEEQLKKLVFDVDDIELTRIGKINEINQNLEIIKQHFPVLEQDSLSLAISLESDLDLLESVVANKTGRFSGDFDLELNWIEKDLVWLFSFLSSYFNVSLDLDNLNKAASKAKSEAESLGKILDDLLIKHQNFENHLKELKQELEFYESLQDLLNGFVKKVSDEVDKLNEERKLFMEKVKSVEVDKDELEALLNEETALLEKYQEIGVTSFDEIVTDVKKLIKEVNAIIKSLSEHCSIKNRE